jgi:hypothetical protein
MARPRYLVILGDFFWIRSGNIESVGSDLRARENPARGAGFKLILFPLPFSPPSSGLMVGEIRTRQNKPIKIFFILFI